MFDIQKRAFLTDATLSRRSLLKGAAAGTAAAGGGMLPGIAGAANPPAASYLPPSGRVISEQFGYTDPLEKMRAEFRIYRDWRDEADVLLWYMFTIFVLSLIHI